MVALHVRVYNNLDSGQTVCVVAFQAQGALQVVHECGDSQL